MEQQRTATDVLLSLEKQVKQLVYMHQTLDLNIKVLSNKLNQLIEAVDSPMLANEMEQSMNPIAIAKAPPMKIVEEFNPTPPIPLASETSPVGFRRTGREGVQAKNPTKNVPTPSIKLPEMKAPQVIDIPPTTGKKPLSQRVVDKNGASLFKADIEILNQEGHTVWKGQTGATGKWQTALDPGNYRLNVKKHTTQQNINVAVDLVVNDSTPRELQLMLVK
jgi:hypothetical protein